MSNIKPDRFLKTVRFKLHHKTLQNLGDFATLREKIKNFALKKTQRTLVLPKPLRLCEKKLRDTPCKTL